jgi:hypothetical protein
MRFVKGLMLGTAATFVASLGAQAADLPLKAKAVEYVKVCSLYGAGFFYIPGSDTCIKLGGYLRADVTFNGSGTQGAPAWNGDAGQGNRYRDYFITRERLALTVDTRTATEYGVVRTFGQADFTFDSLGGTANPAKLNTFPGSTSAAAAANVANNPNLLFGVGGGYSALEFAFIQFAGFTLGKSASAFATPWQGAPGNITSYLLGGHDDVTGVPNVQYTAQFGNGVSGSIGLEDPFVFNRTSVYNLAAFGSTNTDTSNNLSFVGVSGNAYAGNYAPDVTGNIRVDQAWGLLQFSARAHQVNASYNNLGYGAVANGNSETSGNPESKWGGAVSAGLQVKNLPTGVADDIKLDVTYAKGSTKDVISTQSTSPSFAIFGNSNVAYKSVGFGATTDGVYLPVARGGDGTIHLTESFGFRGAFNHNWDANWGSSLFGSYSAVRYDNTAQANFCGAYRVTVPVGNYTCNPNFNVAQIGANLRWTPVKNLTLTAEATWSHLDQNFSGTATASGGSPLPTAVYEYKDQNAYTGQVRVQRNF